ncbi:glycosyltransferase [Zooshikella marina]|uniref:glycosyltransferase n=1 Tax=Zooshikella ganghwensis TaxID=202772 RepID=UPI001BAF1AA0|nr:glycosyltransferase [Zooshikella ganghwensis]MBU2704611.1 glycosyltransferase [Zooshikella ganghwensis]
MSQKYILHYGSLAGMSFKISEACKKIGYDAKNLILCDRDVDDLSRKLPYHESIFNNNDKALNKALSIYKALKKISNEASLIHYFGANIFFREAHFLYEGPLMRKNNIPMLITFGGSDIRIPRIAKNKNKYFKYFYKEDSKLWEKQLRLRCWSMSKFIDNAVVDPEMLDYISGSFKRLYPFRQPVDIEVFPLIERKNDIPVILHIPTSPKLKGTEYVIKAIDQLKKEGYKFKFILKRQLTQIQVYDELKKADIYVDELRCGSHGVTSVEAMAAGCAVITYIRDDLINKYPKELPIISANIETIYIKLKKLLNNYNFYKELGIKGKDYAKKYHCSNIVAKQLVDIYEDIWSTNN